MSHFTLNSQIPTTQMESTILIARTDREAIHSGQFMVSHFEEVEESQDDIDDDDGEVKMLDPDYPCLSKDNTSCSTEVQLYVPRTIAEHDHGKIGSQSTSHLEIETSLTKLFKCMSLAYSQKLTSPKWNHFKGVRLRWKDKIRLNNVIWRCWHMQFIQKRKTPVCQFASPLDVDIHSNPQSVVLEGKYWKRQLVVIKAEYRKWRRNFISNVIGAFKYDNKSEFDIFEWSPLNEKSVFIGDDWTSDTLFSAINGPFPFPDPREIARGAGIADLIQPSLGPLQPNLDDIDVTFSDLLHSRLAPVPEEEDILKSEDYGLPALIGLDEEVTNTVNDNDSVQLRKSDHENSQKTGPISSIDATFCSIPYPGNCMTTFTNTSSCGNMISSNETQSLKDAVLTQVDPATVDLGMEDNNLTQQNSMSVDNILQRQLNELSAKNVIKGRISKMSQRSFRREPHNYDKAQPTLHQTSIYQQILAEHQQIKQIQLQTTENNNVLAQSTQQQQQQLLSSSPRQKLSSSLYSNYKVASNYCAAGSTNILQGESSQQTNLSNLHSSFDSTPTALSNLVAENEGMCVVYSNKLSIPTTATTSINTDSPSAYLSTAIYGNTPVVPSHLGNNFPKTSNGNKSLLERIFPMEYSNETVESIPNTATATTTTPSNIQLYQPSLIIPSISRSSQRIECQSSQSQREREMFRSNSLPLNVSLQKFEQRSANEHFIYPRAVKGSNNLRTRSNSIHQHTSMTVSTTATCPSNAAISHQLQSSTSEPAINKSASLSKHQSASICGLSSYNISLLDKKPNNAFYYNTSDVPNNDNASSSSMDDLASLRPAPNCTNIKLQNHQQQQQTPKKTLSLPTSVANSASNNPDPHQKIMSLPVVLGPLRVIGTQNSSCFQRDIDSPLSPNYVRRFPHDQQRRSGHIHAEQKRRYNIKSGFDILHSLIPQLQQNPNTKLSKAAMLQKGVEYIKFLRVERKQLEENTELLCKERDALNNSLIHLQSILPENGAPVNCRQGTEHVRQLYEAYVQNRTATSWKYWILGLILEPLLSSYTVAVSNATKEELRRTAFLWIDQHCSLVDLRPAVSNKLKYLSMKTDIFSVPPSTLQEEVTKAIENMGQYLNLNGI